MIAPSAKQMFAAAQTSRAATRFALAALLWLTPLAARASVIEHDVGSTVHRSDTPDFLPNGTTLNDGVDAHSVLTGLSTSRAGVYRSPFEGTTAFGTPQGQYTAVEGDAVAGFNMAGDTLALVWGSPDSWNQITFFAGRNGTGAQVGRVMGGEVAPTDGLGAHEVLISGFGRFQSFELSNLDGGNAFEVADLRVTSVPLPASVSLLAGALLMLGGFGTLRRSVGAAARAG